MHNVFFHTGGLCVLESNIYAKCVNSCQLAVFVYSETAIVTVTMVTSMQEPFGIEKPDTFVVFLLKFVDHADKKRHC